MQAMIAEWSDYICGETLADSLEQNGATPDAAKSVQVGEATVSIWIVRNACSAKM